MKTEQKTLLKAWRDELGAMHGTHYALSVKIRRLNYFLGIPVIVAAMAIASYIFFTANENPAMWVKMAVGLIALLTAILASLQTFLKYSQQAENHRNASARYQSLFNAIDQVLVIPPRDEQSLAEWCDKFRERWDELNLEAPCVPRRQDLSPPAGPALPAEEPDA